MKLSLTYEWDCTPEEFWAFAKGETEKWREVIERAGIKVE